MIDTNPIPISHRYRTGLRIALMLTWAIGHRPPAIGQTAESPTPGAKAESRKPRADPFGDPLPSGALARMGTVRWRHGAEVRRLVFAPDGKTLVSWGGDGNLCLWEAATGKEIRHLHQPRAELEALRLCRSGELLALFRDAGGVIRLVDFATHTSSPAAPKIIHGPGPAREDVTLDASYCLAISADGRTLAAARAAESDRGPSIQLLERSTVGGQHPLKELRRLTGRLGRVCWLDFAPNGKTLASWEIDGTLRLWGTATGKQQHQVDGLKVVMQGTHAAVAFSPDGRLLALGLADQTILLWDTGTGKEVRRLKGHRGPVQGVVFSPDGTRLFSGSEDGALRLWEVSTGRTLRTLRGERVMVEVVAFAPDGRTLASGGHDNRIRLWNSITGKELYPSPGHEWGLKVAAFSADGAILATGGSDGFICLCETKTSKLLLRLVGEPNICVEALVFAADGTTLASASRDGLIRLWDVRTGKERRRMEVERGSPSFHLLAFTGKGKTLISGSKDGLVRLWDPATGKQLRSFRVAEPQCFALALSPDGRMLAAVPGDLGQRDSGNVISLWEVKTGRAMGQLPGHKGGVGALAFSPDGKTLVAADGLIGYEGLAARARDRGRIHWWEVAAARTVRVLPASAAQLVFTHDGRVLVAAEDNALVLYEAVTGKPRRRLTGHRGSVTALAVGGDGHRFASTSMDLTALVWDFWEARPRLQGR